MGVCCQHQVQPPHLILDYTQVTHEPVAQFIPNLVAIKNCREIPRIVNQQYESQSIESLPSIHDVSEQEQKTHKSLQRFNSRQTVLSKQKSITTPSTRQTLFTHTVKFRKISSFALEEDRHSLQDDDSQQSQMENSLMDVDLRFRHEAIISIQKIQSNSSTQRK